MILRLRGHPFLRKGPTHSLRQPTTSFHGGDDGGGGNLLCDLLIEKRKVLQMEVNVIKNARWGLIVSGMDRGTSQLTMLVKWSGSY